MLLLIRNTLLTPGSELSHRCPGRDTKSLDLKTILMSCGVAVVTECESHSEASASSFVSLDHCIVRCAVRISNIVKSIESVCGLAIFQKCIITFIVRLVVMQVVSMALEIYIRVISMYLQHAFFRKIPSVAATVDTLSYHEERSFHLILFQHRKSLIHSRFITII